MNISEEIKYKLLKEMEAGRARSQRQLAKYLGMSLGKANFCIKALVNKGLIKAKNFKNSENKWAYSYMLTPQGLEEKARLTVSFLKRKMTEYDEIKVEIQNLQAELENMNVKLEDDVQEIE